MFTMSSTRQHYAVLGLGLMGSRIATRLAALGHHVTGWNRTFSDGLADRCAGVDIKASPSEAVRNAQAVLLLLHDADAVREVITNSNLLEGLSPSALIVDMGTNDPDTAIAMGETLHDRAIFVDGPVSGGTNAAEDGTLVIFLGADEPLARKAMPFIEPLGKPTAFGGLGKGQAAKLANQIGVAVTIAGLAETLAFAEHLGLPTDQLLATMAGGLAGSRVLDLIGPRLLAGDLAPRGRATTHLKDLAPVFAVVPGELDVLPATRAARAHLLALGDKASDLDHGAMLLSARAAFGDGLSQEREVTPEKGTTKDA